MPVTSIRVNFADTDAMGVVYNANYLIWFEVGRTDLIRSWGMPYTEFARRGINVPVAEAGLRYLFPARYDDVVNVETTVAELTPARIKFMYRIVRADDGKLLCEGFTMHGFINAQGRAIAIAKAAPDMYQALLARFKA
ncbi:MAG TPA: thioesterase family protein [Symbiobacteriaceae bacterium]|jgi:acyl-CoA thioester hydrolase